MIQERVRKEQMRALQTLHEVLAAPKSRPKPSCSVCRVRICSLPMRSWRLKSYGVDLLSPHQNTFGRFGERHFASGAHRAEQALNFHLRENVGSHPLLSFLSVAVNHVLVAGQFIQTAGAVAVTINASTRFNDGGEFCLGAEIGISTDKSDCRGLTNEHQLQVRGLRNSQERQ